MAFQLAGVTTDGNASWSGIFTTSQFAGPYQNFLPILAANGSVTFSYAATITATENDAALATVPEPATFILFGAGLVAVALLRRRKARKAT